MYKDQRTPNYDRSVLELQQSNPVSRFPSSHYKNLDSLRKGLIVQNNLYPNELLKDIRKDVMREREVRQKRFQTSIMLRQTAEAKRLKKEKAREDKEEFTRKLLSSKEAGKTLMKRSRMRGSKFQVSSQIPSRIDKESEDESSCSFPSRGSTPRQMKGSPSLPQILPNISKSSQQRRAVSSIPPVTQQRIIKQNYKNTQTSAKYQNESMMDMPVSLVQRLNQAGNASKPDPIGKAPRFNYSWSKSANQTRQKGDQRPGFSQANNFFRKEDFPPKFVKMPMESASNRKLQNTQARVPRLKDSTQTVPEIGKTTVKDAPSLSLAAKTQASSWHSRAPTETPTINHTRTRVQPFSEEII